MGQLIDKTALRKELSKLPSEMGFVRKSDVMQILGNQKCSYDDKASGICEWVIDGVFLVSPHNTFYNCVSDGGYRYTFCPVCGKKIKPIKSGRKIRAVKNK